MRCVLRTHFRDQHNRHISYEMWFENPIQDYGDTLNYSNPLFKVHGLQKTPQEWVEVAREALSTASKRLCAVYFDGHGTQRICVGGGNNNSQGRKRKRNSR